MTPQPGRCGVVVGAWPYEAGQASEIVAHWCNFKTGALSTQPVRKSKVPASGVTFQLPCGRDVGPLSKNSCRARLCLLVAVARLAGRWCFWRLLVFIAGVWVSDSFVSLFEGADPRTGARGLASRKKCRLVSRRSCSVQNVL